MNGRIDPGADERLPPDGTGRPLALRIGEAADFGDPEQHRRLCVSGFGPPEHDGAWTEQAEALLVLELAEDAQTQVALWITQKPFVTPDHAQIFDVAWNGSEVGRVRLDVDRADSRMLKIVQPAECVGAPRASIAFRFRSLSSPAEAGHSDDTRPLGLKLERLLLTRADAAGPPPSGERVIVVEAPTQAERLARIEATCDLLMTELRRTQALVEQLHRSADRVAQAFDRMRDGQDPDGD